MHKGVRKMWVDALRGGRYRKGTKRLREVIGTEPHYCVMGVLADIYCQKTKGGKWEGNVLVMGPHENQKYTTHLPREVLEWAKLDEGFPEIKKGSGVHTDLGTLNDIGIATFDEMAEMIEDNL